MLAHNHSREVLADIEIAALKAANESPASDIVTFTTVNGPHFCTQGNRIFEG